MTLLAFLAIGSQTSHADNISKSEIAKFITSARSACLASFNENSALAEPLRAPYCECSAIRLSARVNLAPQTNAPNSIQIDPQLLIDTAKFCLHKIGVKIPKIQPSEAPHPNSVHSKK
jgi:hypothetical protein